MSENDRIIAIAGGSGFIGRAIVRRLAAIPGLTVRVLTRDPVKARVRLAAEGKVDFVSADVNDPARLATVIAGADTIINAVQFDGYPIEKPSRGLTFNRVDYGGTVSLIAATKAAGVPNFIYISGAAADERSPNPAFRAKGRAERALRDAGLAFTILRPSLVYGPEDRVVNGLAKAIRMMPVMVVPGSGQQKLRPLLVDDLAACVALAIGGRGRNGIYEVGGPDPMTFDELVRLVMEITGHKRPIIHVPENLLLVAGAVAEKLPGALFSRDAVAFLVADNDCDIQPLVAEFGLTLTSAREGLAYLARG
ncbi:MAG TPA: NAD(P)H-binding protein [Candidatus Binataceae bacterium]|nr:NAD(P)H-binding protein [Candidatus Binataceae bacterium]